MNLFIFLFLNLSFSSPHPLSGSSIVNNTQSNIVFSQLGFKVSAVPTNWIYKNGLDPSSKSIEMGPPDVKSKATLSFRLENVVKKTNLEQYVRQYLRDYNQYGFEVTSLQSNIKNVVPSVIVDLTQKNKQTKSRQVFFLQNEKVIIASCIDDFDHFDKTVLNCNQILGSFQWIK
jgi:hypothetical protein